ncbi:MDR family MFS transporter [Virgibacillus doumboii]|uniref:MDR family MFS transporter n=1 Tax=Virgibacillus doumboii TaxID=2697503 RepID=UPI0013E0CC59|nr:MFS transporter [Virgibacillus doumboii]
MFKTLHPNVRIRIYTSFLSRIVGSAVFPFMAIYFTNHINAYVAGILVLIQVTVQFLIGLYGGYLADIIGRKRLMVAGEIMKVVAFTGMLIANSPLLESPWIMFAMLLITGASSGLINPAAEAMLIDVSTKETRAFMYSINYWAINMSLMIGLIVGGWLFEEYLFELLAVLIIISLITLWMTVVLIKETHRTIEQQGKQDYGIKPLLKSYQIVIKDWSFIAFVIGGVAMLAIEFQRNNYIAVRLEQEIIPRTLNFFQLFSFQLDGVKLLSLLTIANTLMIIFFTTAITKWIKDKNERTIMYIGFVLFGVGYAYLAFSNNIAAMFGAIIVLSIGELMYVPTRQSLLADIVDDSRRGSYMAFNNLVFQLGKMFGALGLIVGNIVGGVWMAAGYLILVVIAILFSRISIKLYTLKNEENKIMPVFPSEGGD